MWVLAVFEVTVHRFGNFLDLFDDGGGGGDGDDDDDSYSLYVLLLL